MQKRTILVVDDEPFLLEYVRQVVQRGGYDVLLASDADEAWSILQMQGSDVDVVLTDIVMPSSIDGLGLAENIRRSHPELPVIFMTGAVPEDDIRTRTLVQSDRILRKPFYPDQLMEILRENSCVIDA